MPGLWCSTAHMSVAVGTSSSWVLSKVAATPVDFTSTTGDSPVTVTVSATVAICMSASTVKVAPVTTRTASKTTVWKPLSSN